MMSSSLNSVRRIICVPNRTLNRNFQKAKKISQIREIENLIEEIVNITANEIEAEFELIPKKCY